MLSLIYMKILESSPQRYDRGIAMLTMGAAPRMVAELIDGHVHEGERVLDIGCGTGAASIRAAGRGAHVVAFDTSSQMLAVAERKTGEAGPAGTVEYKQMGVSEMQSIGSATVDVVAACLVMSELSPDEQSYALRHAHRCLKPGGRIIITDEVTPDRILPRILHRIARFPLLLVTYTITQTTTRPVGDLRNRLEAAGFVVTHARTTALGSFLGLVAEKREQT